MRLGVKHSPIYLADLFELTKPRICTLALLMSSLGYFLGSSGQFNWLKFFAATIGTGLVGAAACAFNQVVEEEIDGRMWRTMNRPLPSGRLDPNLAVKMGIVFAVLGAVILMVLVNPPTIRSSVTRR